ncbi:MAG: hypothetical protein WKG07_12440 [Hymenobacter sp.]
MVRAKPDYASIDGCSTSFFGQKFANQDPKRWFPVFRHLGGRAQRGGRSGAALAGQPQLHPGPGHRPAHRHGPRY